MKSAALLLALLSACASPGVQLGIRDTYNGECTGDGTVVIRYHFGASFVPPQFGETRCWMRTDGLPMCRIDLDIQQGRFSNMRELAKIGHEACHAFGGHHDE